MNSVADVSDDLTDEEWLRIAKAMADALDEPHGDLAARIIEAKKIVVVVNEVFAIGMERVQREREQEAAQKSSFTHTGD